MSNCVVFCLFFTYHFLKSVFSPLSVSAGLDLSIVLNKPFLPEASSNNRVGSGWWQTLTISPAFPRSLAGFPCRWTQDPAVADPPGTLAIVLLEVLASLAEGLLGVLEVNRMKTCGFAVLCCCCAAALRPDQKIK